MCLNLPLSINQLFPHHVPSPSMIRCRHFVMLRLLMLVTAIISTLLVGTPPVNSFGYGSKYSSSAIRYFAWTNVLMIFTVVPLPFLCICKRENVGQGVDPDWLFIVCLFDIAFQGLFLPGIGAAGAMAVLERQDVHPTSWGESFCSSHGEVCRRLEGAVAVSCIGALAILFHSVFALSNLYEKAKKSQE